MSGPRHLSGFTLIEVMCGILILGVGIAGLSEGIATALRSSRESQLLAAALVEAEGVIEMLRADGYVTDGSSEGECSAGLKPHRWKRTVSATDLEGLHDVEVVVEDGRTGKVICELRTLVFEAPSSLTSSDPKRDQEKSSRRGNRERTR